VFGPGKSDSASISCGVSLLAVAGWDLGGLARVGPAAEHRQADSERAAQDFAMLILFAESRGPNILEIAPPPEAFGSGTCVRTRESGKRPPMKDAPVAATFRRPF